MNKKTKTCPVKSSPYFTGIIFFILILIVTVLNLPQKALAAGEAITTVTVIEKAGVTTQNYPLTFGHIFKKGDAPEYVAVRADGVLLNTQCEVKRRWEDGSIKHAILSIVIPNVPANGSVALSLETSSVMSVTGEMGKSAILATDVESNINISNLSGSGYSGSVSTSLRDAINDGTLEYWLKGPICTEILEDRAMNNSLHGQWEARFYPGTSFGIRISDTVTNMQGNYRGDVTYDVSITHGKSSPTQIITEANVNHFHNSRWRRVQWLGPEPPETELHYDFPYLQSTNLLYNYDDTLTVPESVIADKWSLYQSKNLSLMGMGLDYGLMGTAGDRDDIGPLPAWDVYWLYTMDNRAKEMMLDSAERGAHYQVHLIENDNTKTFYNHAVSINDRPNWQTYYATENGTGGLPAAIGSRDFSTVSPDKQHQPAFNYLPYIITGDRFYLDEMYHWSAWSMLSINPDPGWGRDGNKGLIRVTMLTRAMAWTLRNIADAATIAPKTDIEQAYFEEKLNNNIDYLVNQRISETPIGAFGYNTTLEQVDASVTHACSPWQEDYLAFTTSHIFSLGYTNIKPWIDHAANFIIKTITDPAVNPYNGPGYRYPVEQNGAMITTVALANSLITNDPTSFPVPDSVVSYRFSRMGALAVLADYPDAVTGLSWMKAHVDPAAITSWGDNPKYALQTIDFNLVDSVPPSNPIGLTVY